MRRLLTLALAPVLVIACSSSSRDEGYTDPNSANNPGGNGTGIGAGTGTGTGSIGGDTKPAPTAADKNECQKMDILFVVDDSGSMGEEQANLTKNFPEFVKVLNEFKTKSGTAIDYRVAVTTTGRDVSYTIQVDNPFGGQPIVQKQTEKGDNGAFRGAGKCSVKERWLDKSSASVSKDFACLANVGTSGPSLEMPLETIKLSLVDRVNDGTNKGFRREDALLAVVVLTDENDCSRGDNNFTVKNGECEDKDLTPIANYASMLDQAAGGPGRWAIAAIAGPNACESSFGSAVEAKRLKSLVATAGKNGTFSSICDGDLSKGLKSALDTFDGACKNLPPAIVK
jgi:hypothetical protein